MQTRTVCLQTHASGGFTVLPPFSTDKVEIDKCSPFFQWPSSPIFSLPSQRSPLCHIPLYMPVSTCYTQNMSFIFLHSVLTATDHWILFSSLACCNTTMGLSHPCGLSFTARPAHPHHWHCLEKKKNRAFGFITLKWRGYRQYLGTHEE